jgi:hypothetical protein
VIDSEYKTFVRMRACAFCGAPPPAEGNHPHHIRYRQWRNVRRNDATCVSACFDCHARLHQLGISGFLVKRGMSIPDLVEIVVDCLTEYLTIKATGVSTDPVSPF